MSRVLATSSKGLPYEQLSDEAKAKAREWWQGLACTDDGWWEQTYHDAILCFLKLGFFVAAEDIQFSGFWSQGDGASFGGFYEPVKGSALGAIKEHAPEDETLHALATQLDALQVTAVLQWGAEWKCRIGKSSSRYCHSGCMEVTELELNASATAFDSWAAADVADEPIKELQSIARSLADWLYAQLEAEYEYQTSDEVAKEALETSGYRFDEFGHII